MTTLLANMGDRMLGLLLGERTAGACTANYQKGCGCTSDGRWKRYDCAGVCRRTQFAC